MQQPKTTGQKSDERLWPLMLLLLVAVSVPTTCVLWFMNKAVKNERLAVRQRQADTHRALLLEAQLQLRDFWFELVAVLDKASDLANETGAGLAFQSLITQGHADTALFFDKRDSLIYPSDSVYKDLPEPSGWKDSLKRAQKVEFVEKDPAAAAHIYDLLANNAPSNHLAARALVARARNLLKADKKEEALSILIHGLNQPRFTDAVESRGRLVVPSALLMALDLMGPDHEDFQATAERMATALINYAPPVMPPAQRRFLMNRYHTLFPDAPPFPTEKAEQLATQIPAGANLERSDIFTASPLEGFWQIGSSDGLVLALVSHEHLMARMMAQIERLQQGGVRITVLSPGASGPTNSTTTLDLETRGFPGWRLSLYASSMGVEDALAESRITAYYWVSILVILAVIVVAIFVARYHRLQMRLTRLKNDLVATVTHELKTPLASMRMLVDTLLDGHYTNPEITREYLELIHKENIRLSRLIENFLTFSRMERNRHNFTFERVSMTNIARAALASIEDKLHGAGFETSYQWEDHEAEVLADDGALVTVVLNLLENAFKYSGERKHIAIRTFTVGDEVRLAVTDKGIGLSRRDTRKIFTRFYRVDQSLSRRSDGVGLGLSIVQYILKAHGGTIMVNSQLGMGSTFTICLPRAGSDASKKILRQ